MGWPTDGQAGLARRHCHQRKENDMRRSIVCGIDGSADSQAALGVAASLAERLAVRLVLAHAAEFALVPYAAVGGMGGIALWPPTLAKPDEQEEAGARLLEQIATEAGLEDAERRVVSACRPNGSPIWPTRKTPS
jgi:nucleotide-binding universal stress UspA family protein